MRIDVYNSAGGAAFFQGLLNQWRSFGVEVVAHEAVSESEYRAPRGLFGKLRLRWKMYPGYGWTCWRSASKPESQNGIRVVVTNPFFAPALVTHSARGRGLSVNLLYDLYPDALVQAGQLTAGSWLERRCAAITRYALRECAVTVFLGERLRSYAESVHGKARRAVVIPVGADGAPFEKSPPVRGSAEVPVQILYSGQLGRMHDSATVVEAWKLGASSKHVKWVFHASGSGYEKLRLVAGQQSGVEWGGSLPGRDWEECMKRSEIALVTMSPGAERIVMPSKTYSALVAGQAILAICPRESDLADLVERHRCGWVIEPGDASGLTRLLESLRGDSDDLFEKRIRAYEAGHTYYDVKSIARQWMSLMRELTASVTTLENVS